MIYTHVIHTYMYAIVNHSVKHFSGGNVCHTRCALEISISLTAVVLIQERKEGLMDRTWVAGVNVTEIIISEVLTQFFILLVQIILMLIFVLWVFKVWQQLSNCRSL